MPISASSTLEVIAALTGKQSAESGAIRALPHWDAQRQDRVTNERRKVGGVKGLYVCHASLMPMIPCASNLSTITMAGKVADVLRSEVSADRRR